MSPNRKLFITTRVRSTREGNVLTRVCVSVYTCWGDPISGLGRGGTPSQVWVGGYPISGLGGVPPPSIASTCYAAGGMPLAFTQGDFLVAFIFCVNPKAKLSDNTSSEMFISSYIKIYKSYETVTQ